MVDLSKIKIGMTRAEVKAVLGEPDAVNIGSRKYPKPTVFKYEEIEFHFEYPEDGRLVLVYTEVKGKPNTIMKYVR